MFRALRVWWLAVLLPATSACGNGTSEASQMPVRIDVVATPPLLRCPQEAQAPIPNGTAMDAVDCVPVGPTAGAASMWPEAPMGTTFRMPVRYVSPGAPAGGDGSQTMPFATSPRRSPPSPGPAAPSPSPAANTRSPRRSPFRPTPPWRGLAPPTGPTSRSRAPGRCRRRARALRCATWRSFVRRRRHPPPRRA